MRCLNIGEEIYNYDAKQKALSLQQKYKPKPKVVRSRDFQLVGKNGELMKVGMKAYSICQGID